MSITSSIGMGSGIDINALVDDLITAEGKPIFSSIHRQQNAVQTKISAIGTLKGSLSSLQTQMNKFKYGDVFKTLKTTSSDSTIITATASSGSIEQKLTVQVAQLACEQKSISVAEFQNPSALIGAGTVTLNATNGNSFSVVADDTTTLSSLCQAINDASDNIGITASIMSVDSLVTPGTTISKLVLMSDSTGVNNGFTLTGTSTLGLTNLIAAQDAQIIIDGQLATRDTNVISDVISGVVFDLQQASPGVNVNIEMALDKTVLMDELQNFVTSYNSCISVLKQLMHVGASASDRGPMAGDSMLQGLTMNLRAAVMDPVTGITSSNNNTLSAFGILIDRNGVMVIDNDVLTTNLSSDTNTLSDLFSLTDTGISSRLGNVFNSFLSHDGAVETQVSSLNQQKQSLSDKEEVVDKRLRKHRESLLKQFVAMDMLVGQYKTKGNFIKNLFYNKNQE